MPWVITWLAHSAVDEEITARAYDYLLCAHPHASFYLAAAVVISTISLAYLEQEEAASSD
jgi:hypothetical protein